MRKMLLPALALLFAASAAQADEPGLDSVLMADSAGCMAGPTEQFGRYLGDWAITDQNLSKDGKEWSPGPGARWNFVCVGNGIAVQDFWMPNGKEGAPLPGVGTNFRIYDPKAGRWDITWTATNAPGLLHIRAVEEAGGNMVLNFISPEQNPPRRITFFPPTSEGWDWVLELSFDSGTTWTAVYKIKATPRP